MDSWFCISLYCTGEPPRASSSCVAKIAAAPLSSCEHSSPAGKTRSPSNHYVPSSFHVLPASRRTTAFKFLRWTSGTSETTSDQDLEALNDFTSCYDHQMRTLEEIDMNNLDPNFNTLQMVAAAAEIEWCLRAGTGSTLAGNMSMLGLVPVFCGSRVQQSSYSCVQTSAFVA